MPDERGKCGGQKAALSGWSCGEGRGSDLGVETPKLWGAEVEAREEARGQARGGVSMDLWETLGGGHRGGG